MMVFFIHDMMVTIIVPRAMDQVPDGCFKVFVNDSLYLVGTSDRTCYDQSLYNSPNSDNQA